MSAEHCMICGVWWRGLEHVCRPATFSTDTTLDAPTLGGELHDLSDGLVDAMERLHQYPRQIAEVAAREAVAVYRARMMQAVTDLPPIQPIGYPEPVGGLVGRADVLAVLHESRREVPFRLSPADLDRLAPDER